MKIFMQTPYGQNKFFENNKIDNLSFHSYLSNNRKFKDIVLHGLSGSSLFAKIQNPFFIQKMYLEKDKNYMKYLYEFKERFYDYDVLVMNPGVDLVHPEFLYRNFPNSLKCLHFIDDPHTTYSYSFPFSWVFDCATYISPSYSENFNMSEILTLAGFKNIRWVPHCVSNIEPKKHTVNELENQLDSRNNKAIYVGGFYTNKNDRLIYLKKNLKKNLDIFGRYPLKGFSFSVFSSLKGFPSVYRVKKITHEQREEYYSQYSIGLNMHLSTPNLETGNARLYELAYRGLAQVVDDSPFSLVKTIFKPEEEILTYSNIDDCVEQINRLIANKDLRIKLAINAYKRAIDEYNYEKNLSNLIKWFKSLSK